MPPFDIVGGFLSADCDRHAVIILTLITLSTGGQSSSGLLGSGRRFASNILFGKQLDGDPAANIRSSKSPRTISSLKVVVYYTHTYTF